jgi:hypothetical protein
MSKRVPTTIYLDPKIAKGLKVRAALNGETMSDVANRTFARTLEEDRRDIELARKRAKGKFISYEEFLKRCKRDGLL